MWGYCVFHWKTGETEYADLVVLTPGISDASARAYELFYNHGYEIKDWSGHPWFRPFQLGVPKAEVRSTSTIWEVKWFLEGILQIGYWDFRSIKALKFDTSLLEENHYKRMIRWISWSYWVRADVLGIELR